MDWGGREREGEGERDIVTKMSIDIVRLIKVGNRKERERERQTDKAQRYQLSQADIKRSQKFSYKK